MGQRLAHDLLIGLRPCQRSRLLRRAARPQLPEVPSVQPTVRVMPQVPAVPVQECPAMFHAASFPLGRVWQESLSKPSSCEGPGAAAAHSSNSDRGLGSVFQETRELFSEKKVTAGTDQGSLLPGAVLSATCMSVHLSCPLTAEGRAIITSFIRIFQVNCILCPGPHSY